MKERLLKKAERLVKLCKTKGLTVATAESCTGGLLSHVITRIPGASDVLLAGLVTYSNAAKQQFLKVPKELIDKNGAVSAEVARSMAKNCKNETKADIALSITGIAGPGGGSDEKPVGLVYLGCASHKTYSHLKLNCSGKRDEIQEQATEAALDEIISQIERLP